MKKIFILSVFCSISLFGQIENFVIENNQVYWQKIYDNSKTLSELKDIIKTINGFKITNETDTSVSGEFKGLIMDYKGAGYSFMATPIILNETNKYYGLFNIEVKDNRYRATVRNLQSEGMTLNTYGSIGLGTDLDTTLEEMALQKGKNEFRKAFLKSPSKIIDNTLAKLFNISEYTIKKDNW